MNDYKLINPDYQLYIINYDMLHKCDDKFDLIILDESHSLGQYPKPSERTKYLKKYVRISLLSTSPNANTRDLLTAISSILVCSYSPWGQYRNFTNGLKLRDTEKKHFYNREINDYSKRLKKSFADISHLFLSYTQKEAGFISEVEDVIITIPMPDKVKRYKYIKEVRS